MKIRTGPPTDADSPDAALGLWAGELPLATTWQQPIPDPALPPGTPVPAHSSSRAGTGRPEYQQLTRRELGSSTSRSSLGSGQKIPAGNGAKPAEPMPTSNRAGLCAELALLTTESQIPT